MVSLPPAQCCTTGFEHEGMPTGKLIKVRNQWDAYLATPEPGKGFQDIAVLILPDVVGIWQNSKLIADHFARQGFLTIIIDILNGDPLPLNRPPGFDVAGWLQNGSDGKTPHTKEFIDPIVVAAVNTLKSDFNAKRVGAVGYCLGAKFVCRHYESGIDVGYIAHPSFVDEDEIANITGPLSIAAAEVDQRFPPNLRHLSEAILKKTGQPFQINLFSGVGHGFALRCDLSSKQERFAMEQALNQAVEWFKEWLPVG